MKSLLLGTAAAVATFGLSPAWAAEPDADRPPSEANVATPGDRDILVTGQLPRSTAAGGTKTDTPLIETPQSISVVSSGDINALGFQNLNQALSLVAGVTPEQRGSAAEVYDQFSLRGFTVDRYLDGLRVYNSPTGYADTQVDVSRVDRYEVVKGPASALYGQSSPGGLVAIESKLPLQSPFYGGIAGTYGNYDLYRVDADIGGVTGPVAYRLYGSANGAHTQQRLGIRRRQTVSGAVTVGGDTRTSLTVLAAYSHDPENGLYGVSPASGVFLPNPNGRVSTRFTGSEPGDRFAREQAGLTYIFRHDFGGGWVLRSSGRYQYVSSKLGISYVSGAPFDAAQRLVSRYSYATREQLNGWTFDNRLTGKLATGPIEHNLLFGADRQVLHARELYAFGSSTPIDIFNPVYGAGPYIPAGNVNAVPGYPGFPTVPGLYAPQLRQQGVYGQDQLALGDFRLVASGRYDWVRTTLYTAVPQHDRKFTWRVGANYLLPFGLAPYVSYATSFQPQLSPVSDDGGRTTRNATPTTGRQIEAGAKYQPPGTQILVTAAWFRINQSNVLTAVPLVGYSVQSGKVRSQGVEVEATAPLPFDFNARLALSRQKVRITANADPQLVGTRPYGVAKANATAYLEWAPKQGSLAGFAIGGDVRYVGKTSADVVQTSATTKIEYQTPAYTVFDATVRYDLGKAVPALEGVTLQVNARNLADKRYITSCYVGYGWCWYGNRRTVQGTVAYRW